MSERMATALAKANEKLEQKDSPAQTEANTTVLVEVSPLVQTRITMVTTAVKNAKARLYPREATR
jgi:hypothetical protein